MINAKNSDLILPISVTAHLCIINGLLFLLTPDTYTHVYYILHYNISWLLITYGLGYYVRVRKERFMTNIHKMVQLYLIYGLAYFSLFGITGRIYESLEHQLFVYLTICIALTLYRALFFWVRRKYRLWGGNSVKVVVIGRDKNLKKIRKVFDEPELGYRYMGYFDDKKSKSKTYLGPVIDCFLYILENDIDEIYCVASKFNNKELRNLIDFADNNLIRIKIIPDNKEVYSRGMSIELYDTIPVLNLRKVPLDTEFARISKRSFDILFSSLVILTVLSWLVPIMYVLIKLESPGDLYFKQKRHGLKRKTFWCYKFRSMRPSKDADSKMATKGDMRVTRIGKFIRKTSIDELPQFFNVFLGDMSVVGPRPHMELHTWDYEVSVDKYLVRHFVKPGITGLAQVKGYRGEIAEKKDILNRTKLDIFYVEKWSLLLDLQIIVQTVVNAVRGEEKAY
ncbi:exopolysaccharide biosynthesis polyprenyl glycosylphosphotransferase [Zobellia galactanivorans]|uniref:exopolysaccharide biosynthesis polyprenyl glycosylphosphotransferase n=1 Tax=Zobellia galactanivorans (strain DSM 12802 / CCUG 47099 / CIP 106680 / NCIMB 13871 / Dsij) TaxID=63186 RepID=UPI001C06F406|nr:exopolysaccharide biosynthesis polyprenyl glycosylphosphotransferase [Zobellia galactanivorans]MBU3028352.1 exopolysaccharide biosynthesis polyprenyl glycosylphosphotransferase [Zobellia galactanivorans]